MRKSIAVNYEADNYNELVIDPNKNNRGITNNLHPGFINLNS